ncbi:hypothetical protein [Photobacterium angustum]|uniref:hypothetical protein n=1 Tax=Photobacterium angustum TaxID=661 RepID=UPI0005E52DD4|nr:hypothetical protein [Photobacterium angustum]KJF94174.1 hypothetical protein UB39_12175 [Photobacterium angustum]PSW78761.1 hypothetical protein CTN03_17765 [Photobacterium angustum]
MLSELSNIWGSRIKEWENVEETFSYFSASAKIESCLQNDTYLLKSLLTKLKTHQDKIVIKIFISKYSESYEFSNIMSVNDFDTKENDLFDEIDCLDDDDKTDFSVEININKKVSSNIVNTLIDHIYSISAWSNYLDRLSLEELHQQIYCRYYDPKIEKVIFLGDYSESISTDYFHFIPKSKSPETITSKFNNQRATDLIKLRSNLGHFANASEWCFLPDHFKFSINSLKEFDTIITVFNALHNVYLISFIANFTIVKDGKVEYNLKGLKNITDEYDFCSLKNIDSSPLWRLYQWIYQSNSVDKLGVTRNIIPLHIDKLLNVNDAVLTSSYSSFSLSQKNDVKSYIDATNKLSEQVIITSQKASDIAGKIATSLKTGIWGIGAFAVSTVLFRIFSKGSEISTFQGVFDLISSPIFVSVILLAFLIFSTSFWLAIYESHSDQTRFKDTYEETKSVYKNVLTNNDINNILSNNSSFNNDNTFINNRRHLYIKLWLIQLLVMIIILLLNI